MKPVPPENLCDPRVAVLLILAVALIVLPPAGNTSGPASAPAFALEGNTMVRRLPPHGGPAAGLQAAGEEPDLPPRVALFFNRPFRINRAGRASLTMLPGIGPRLADRILSRRASHGPFTSAADLLQVSGIGPDRIRRLAPLLSFR